MKKFLFVLECQVFCDFSRPSQQALQRCLKIQRVEAYWFFIDAFHGIRLVRLLLLGFRKAIMLKIVLLRVGLLRFPFFNFFPYIRAFRDKNRSHEQPS
jgi:hypothetical protein